MGKELQRAAGITADGIVGPATRRAMTASNISKMRALYAPIGYYYAYAKGGLITHTGPAWLDGTKLIQKVYFPQ